MAGSLAGRTASFGDWIWPYGRAVTVSRTTHDIPTPSRPGADVAEQSIGDSELVERVLAGDRACFRHLLHRYQRVLFNIALRMVDDRDEAEDVAQLAFVKAYQNLHSFDPNRRFFSWIYRITVNEALRAIDRRKPNTPLDQQHRADTPTPAERLERERRHTELLEAVQALAPHYRQVVVLRYFGELNYREIAETLEIPEKTVKSRLFTARRLLAETLAEKGMAG